ncbi:exonuclease [Mycobacterium phage Asayake]|nr:MRE11 double-strand break endo/exonuclease [Mycobacterium phage BEEST]QWY80022.1 exonuclease [Mycobacterium phage Asayake]QWY81139.1 exonuclease [Mycobacterium phage Blizzard]QWY81235.1 exonuclease [Mycobacterium phage Durfee]QWY82631.1 MRE11 double-strand break endo/exonuclease [Mycobacterium phage Padfoot]UDL15096.1 MRE11 double-strand break endo/exonuclease [Mycobacterium phage CaseJules]UGL63386.1 MRE11 double-strand break endo/exonuclease [Mycobacterium phage Boiiii]UOK18257.1 MRE11 
MSLSDRLATPAAANEKYRPTVEFDNRGATIDTGTVYQEPGQPPEYAEILRQVGRDPERFRLVEILSEKHWQVPYRPYVRDDDGQPIFNEFGKPRLEEQEFRWAASYKLRVEPIDRGGPSDLEALIADARKVPTIAPATTSPYWYVFQAGDLQLGKRSRDGSTEQIVERFVQSLEAAGRQYRELVASVGIAGVQISMPGDCIEGVVSQKGANSWLTQETIAEQFRLLRRLMVEAVDTFRAAPAVYLDVVNGNHDQANRQWNTNPGDGWATEAAIAVRDAMVLNRDVYGHVEVRVPEPWSGSMTVPVGDTVVTVMHGHQSPKGKALDWLAKQAVHNQPAGACQVLQHGHWHVGAVEMHATKTIVCSPTFDCGSDWFRERQGGESRRGALTYLLRSGEVSNLGVL